MRSTWRRWSADRSQQKLVESSPDDLRLTALHHFFEPVQEGGLVRLDPLEKGSGIVEGGMEGLVLPQ
jgi:hypothetical protein